MGKEKYITVITNAWIFQNFLRRVKVRGLHFNGSVNSTQLHTCIIYLRN